MAPTYVSIASAASMLAMLPATLAGFNPGSSKSVAVYWGQDGAPHAQERLSSYCSNSNIDIIPVAFMNGINTPIVNFASASNACTGFPDNQNLLSCPQIEADIQTCQSGGKTIMLSLGGSTYTEGGWPSTSEAEKAAQMVWDMFGPVPSGKTIDRPLGKAVVDGFDFDFESHTENLAAFAAKLRSLMDAAGGKKFYLSAAPQCPFPDAADGDALNAVPFDFVMIQFYNNYCGIQSFQQGSTTQSSFNFDVWDNWAKTTSPNKNIKLFLGIPATTDAGAGFTRGPQLQAAIKLSQQYSSFGGVMMWDMAELFSTPDFLDEIVSDLQGGQVSPPSTTTAPSGTVSTTAAPSSTFVTSTRRVNKKLNNVSTSATTVATGTTDSPSSTTDCVATGTPVPQWGQCGGEGYTGSTQCQSPYTCVFDNSWWSDCR